MTKYIIKLLRLAFKIPRDTDTITIKKIDADHMFTRVFALDGDYFARAYYDRDHGRKNKGWVIEIFRENTDGQMKLVVRDTCHSICRAAVERAMRLHMRKLAISMAKNYCV